MINKTLVLGSKLLQREKEQEKTLVELISEIKSLRLYIESLERTNRELKAQITPKIN